MTNDIYMHINYIYAYIFVQLFVFLLLIYLRRYTILLVENKKHGSTKELPLLCTCAGEVTTYTTGFPAPIGTVYPFSAGGARGML